MSRTSRPKSGKSGVKRRNRAATEMYTEKSSKTVTEQTRDKEIAARFKEVRENYQGPLLRKESRAKDGTLRVRVKKRLSQHDLAAHLGVTAAAVGQWERGANRPHMATLHKMVDLLETSMEYILTGEAPEERGVAQTSIQKQILDVALVKQPQANLFGLALWEGLPDKDLPGRNTYKLMHLGHMIAAALPGDKIDLVTAIIEEVIAQNVSEERPAASLRDAKSTLNQLPEEAQKAAIAAIKGLDKSQKVRRSAQSPSPLENPAPKGRSAKPLANPKGTVAVP